MSIVNVNLNAYPKKFLNFRGNVYEHYNGYSEENIIKTIKLGIYEKVFPPVLHKIQYPITDVLSHFKSNNKNFFAYHIFVAPGIFTDVLSDTDVFEIPQDVLDAFYNNKVLIILDSFVEHTSIKKDNALYKVLQNTIKKYKLKTENICSVVNTFNTKSILGIDIITRNIPVAVEPLYETDDIKIQENIKTLMTPVKRPYKCIALIRRPRRMRSQFAEFIYQNNLLQDNIISFNSSKEEVEQYNPNLDLKFKDTLPWQNKVETFKDKKVTPKQLIKFFQDYKLYNKAYCEFLFETELDSPSGEVFLSEKLNKPLKYLYPFVFVGEPNSLEIIHNLGFKTFDKWWDESYDNEPDDWKRLQMIIDLVLKLSDYDEKDLLHMYQDMKKTLQHNMDLIENYDVKTNLYDRIF